MQVIFLFSIFKKPIVNTAIQETWFINLFNQLNTFFSRLQGSLCNDYCVVNCCGPCVLCQLARELKSLQRWIANQLTTTRNHCFGTGTSTGSPSSKYEHRRASAWLRNIQNVRICMGKKPIVSVTYENERISIKRSLPYLKCVLRLSCRVHGPIYGLFMGFYVNGFLSTWRFGQPLYIERACVNKMQLIKEIVCLNQFIYRRKHVRTFYRP